MKRITLVSTILLLAILLPACSAPIGTFQKQAAEILRDASERLDPATSETDLKPVAAYEQLAPVPSATPGAPVVSLPAESASVVAAYEGAMTRIYETVNPSVVNIRVLTQASGMSFTLPEQGLPNIPGFPFGEDPNQGGSSPQQQPYAEGQGSGFIWDKEGYIVTNNHVIAGAEKIEVTLWDGTSVVAELVGTDPDSDLAVLKVDLPGEKLQPVQLADTTQVKVGELAVAIGNPYGLEGSMTVGIISAIGRTTPAGEAMSGGTGFSIPDVIQTDAPINPGNSGGVLVDDKGMVIGVTYMIESASGANAGIGFVIPSSIVSRVVPSLIENGSYQHPYLGISGSSLTPTINEAMKLDPDMRGVLISEILPDGPADKAGLVGSSDTATVDGLDLPVGGDVITAIDDEKITGMDELISYLSAKTEVGKTVTLTVLRNGDERQVEVTLQARPTTTRESRRVEIQPQPSSSRAFMGITAGSLTPAIAEAMDLPSDQTGVLVEQVEPGGPADDAGLRGSDSAATIDGQPVMIGGDVIVEIAGKPVGSMEDLVTILQGYKPGDKVNLAILRNGDPVELELTLGERPG